jgi:hypothetical protein
MTKRTEAPEPTGQSDVPNSILTFVDPAETDARHRIVLWAAPGEGKSVGAASAPAPILVISADRPGAYRYARRHHHGKEIREVRYQGPETLEDVYRYLRDGSDVRTVILDPFQTIYDNLVDTGAKNRDGEPNWQAVNKKILGFLYSLREFDVNVVIVAHEKLNDGKKGDGKLYPAVGGPALINKVLAESDIVAHVERVEGQGGEVRYEAQLQPNGFLVCKDATGYGLGDRRPLDLTEWLSHGASPSELPWDDADPSKPTAEELAEAQGTLDTPTDRKASPSEARTILEAGQPLTSVQLLHLLHTVQGKAPHGLDEQAAVRRIGDEVRGLPGDRVQPLLRAIRAATTTGEIA